MKPLLKHSARTLLALLIGLGLLACSEPEAVQQNLAPVAFHDSDECHVCGMIITDFPGPKGQAVDKSAVKKFCSAAEMLGWWLQSENRIGDAKLYVHDMGRSDWTKPDDSQLIDATQECVNGDVRVKLYKGNVILVGRRSEDSLFDASGQERATLPDGFIDATFRKDFWTKTKRLQHGTLVGQEAGVTFLLLLITAKLATLSKAPGAIFVLQLLVLEFARRSLRVNVRHGLMLMAFSLVLLGIFVDLLWYCIASEKWCVSSHRAIQLVSLLPFYLFFMMLSAT